LGQRFAIRVAVPDAPGDSLLGPPAPLQAGDLDIMASGAAPAAGDSVAWVMSGALFRTGDQVLPSMPFLLRGPGGDRLVVTRAYTVSVEATVEPDSAAAMDLRDVRDPVAAPTRFRWLRVAGALALAALVAAGIMLLVRRRRESDEYTAPVVPAIPAHVEAFLALDELEKEALPQRGHIKEHYFGLSHVMRQYVERKFGIPAVESTTDEIRGQIDRTRLDRREADDLLRDLESADLVKFAKYDPGTQAATAALVRGREWVQRTLSSSTESTVGEPKTTESKATVSPTAASSSSVPVPPESPPEDVS